MIFNYANVRNLREKDNFLLLHAPRYGPNFRKRFLDILRLFYLRNDVQVIELPNWST